MMNPTAGRVRALFDYCPDTGTFRWKWRPRYDFASEPAWRTWNTKHAGEEAGYLSTDGYVYLAVDGWRIGAHRVAWLYCNGVLPDHTDHNNGITNDNRIDNLDNTTKAGNAKNQKIRSTNRSGVTGVYRPKGSSLWKAYITVDNRNITLGRFDRFDDAVLARKKAERDYGFHENHGRARRERPS